MSERTPKFINKITKSKYEIYREHILPTNRHLKILEKVNRKIIILLRKPEDVIDSYKRLKKSNKINFDKLTKDVEKFYSSYIAWSINKKKILLITYKQLIKEYNKTMNEIFNFWNLKKPKNYIKLLRKNYTGVGEKRLEENNVTNWTA
jgi:hypothetical protein